MHPFFQRLGRSLVFLATLMFSLSSCQKQGGVSIVPGSDQLPSDDGQLFQKQPAKKNGSSQTQHGAQPLPTDPGADLDGKRIRDRAVDSQGPGMDGGGNGGGSGKDNPPVPEPTTLFLVGTGLAGAALLRHRRKDED